MSNYIYQILDLWAKLSPSICQPKSVANHSLPDEDSNSDREDSIEGATEGVRMQGGVAEEAQSVC